VSAEEDSQVGLGDSEGGLRVETSLATVAAQEGGHRGAQHELISRYDTGGESRRGSQTSPSVTSSEEHPPTRSVMSVHLTLELRTRATMTG
jgi:hypothetical protein